MEQMHQIIFLIKVERGRREKGALRKCRQACYDLYHIENF